MCIESKGPITSAESLQGQRFLGAWAGWTRATWGHLGLESLLDLPVKMSKMCPCPLLLDLLVCSVNAVVAFFLQRATTTSVYAVIMKFGTGLAKQTHTHISLLWGSFWISWPNSHEWDRMGWFNRLIPVRCTLGTGKLVFIPHKRLNTFKRIWLWGPHKKKVKSHLWRFWHPKIAKNMPTQNPTRQHFGV